MQNITRKHFNAYCKRQAEINGVADGKEPFAVEPSVEQKLEDKVRESSGFLQKVNMYSVRDQQGQKLGLDVGSPVASTTDTDTKDRATTDPTTLAKDGYHCQQTNFDTHIKYQKLDAWAKFPDFQKRIRNLVTQQIARDRIMIGFNGTSRVATSDRANNPLLQDVGLGWLQKLRANASPRVMSGIKIGKGGSENNNGGYENIDAAVFDATNELLQEWYRDDSDLVVICGRSLLADKYLSLIQSNNAPTERNALDVIMTNKTLGNLPAVRVPFFPDKAFAITRLDNLSIYYQEGSRKRHIQDNPKRDRIEDYQSINQDYVVEDYGLMGLVEGILLPDGQGGWA